MQRSEWVKTMALTTFLVWFAIMYTFAIVARLSGHL